METESDQNLTPFQPVRLPLRGLLRPDPGVVHLWFLDLLELGNPLDPDTPIRPGEMNAVQKRTLRRFYLRLLLGAYLDIHGKDVSISREVRGKPRLDPSVHETVLDFSMANSRDCCVIAVTTDALIGVDLEEIGRVTFKPMDLARRYFSPHEITGLEELAEAELDAAFLHTWACKEAMVKAAGHGIANRLHRFSVCIAPEKPPAVLEMDDDDPSAWRMALFRVGDDLFGAVSVRHPSLRLERFQLCPPAPPAKTSN